MLRLWFREASQNLSSFGQLFFYSFQGGTKGKMLKNQCIVLAIFQHFSFMLKTSMSWKSVWIYLKSQNKFWNVKIWFKSENKLFCLKIYFKCGPRRVVQCACIQPYHVINLNTRTRHRSVGSMFEIIFSDRIILFQIEIKFSNFKSQFEISNKFKWIFKRLKFWALVSPLKTMKKNV